MYQALYRKWRPQTFDDVCGQEHITSILKYETENNRFSHAYLFCGSRGTGKTTCAKILAKAVNCESPINGNPCNKCPSCRSIDEGTATDVLEMDAASNNGVENIRDIRDGIVYSPSVLKYRVYIVDEVHMLSTSAFNALLKTLEEPPSHAIFVLATTELHKLPATIISRCQRYDFRRITTEAISDRLAFISDNENIKYTREALRIIAKTAQGGMRDAISLLELCAGSREAVTAELVNEALGTGGREGAEKMVRAISSSDFDTVFATVDGIVRSSKDISVFWQELISFYRDMLVIKTSPNAKKYLDLTDDEATALADASALFTKEALLYHCRILDDTLYSMQKAGFAKRTVAEMALIKMCDASFTSSNEALLARISKLENSLAVMLTSGGALPSVESKKSKHAESNYDDNNNGVTEMLTKTGPKSGDAVNKKENGSVTSSKVSDVKPKVLRGFGEIVEKATVGDGAMFGFLKNAKAFSDENGKIIIKFVNDFAKSMVERSNIKKELSAAACMVLQKNVSEDDIIFQISHGSDDGEAELDEFDI